MMFTRAKNFESAKSCDDVYKSIAATPVSFSFLLWLLSLCSCAAADVAADTCHPHKLQATVQLFTHMLSY
jgi:hypothetical protein